jgi:hypothetical protein
MHMVRITLTKTGTHMLHLPMYGMFQMPPVIIAQSQMNG